MEDLSDRRPNQNETSSAMNMPGTKVDFNSDGTIKKLPAMATLSNAFVWWAQWFNNPLVFSACVQWILTSYAKRKRKSLKWPATKFVIFNYLTGQSCAEIAALLRMFGIPSQTLSIFIDLWPDKRGIGLTKTFLVPETQAAMADDILRQYGNGHYVVMTPKRGRGGKFLRPWGVKAAPRSWDEAVTNVMYGFMERGAKAVIECANMDEQDKVAKLPKQADRQPGSTGKKRRKTAKKQPAMKRLRKAIWDA